jgi:hypothetical protein
MDERLLDVIIGLAAFLILAVLLAVLPMVMTAGIGYLSLLLCSSSSFRVPGTW